MRGREPGPAQFFTDGGPAFPHRQFRFREDNLGYAVAGGFRAAPLQAGGYGVRPLEGQQAVIGLICIDEAERSLSLLDERIEKAVKATGAKLIILDPLQGYLVRNVDMNRANEIRDVLKRLTTVADQTGCAIVLIGHLNKAVGANSAYRGLGSMDFRAAARSVLLVGRMKKDPGVRVIVHDKSSLAPEGKSVAFSLGADSFHWLEG